MIFVDVRKIHQTYYNLLFTKGYLKNQQKLE